MAANASETPPRGCRVRTIYVVMVVIFLAGAVAGLIGSTVLVLAAMGISSAVAAANKRHRLAQESEFAAKSSERYCKARILQACLGEGVDTAQLIQLANGDTSVVTVPRHGMNRTNTGNETMWLHCKLPANSVDELLVASDSAPTALLGDANVTETGDRWCERMLQQQNTTEPFADSGDRQALLPGSPYDANKWMFDEYENTLTAQIGYCEWVYGVMAVIVVLQVCCLTMLIQLAKPKTVAREINQNMSTM